MRQLLLALTLCLASPICHAWNAAGHRLVAAIAWDQLSLANRQRVSTILASHPDYERWAKIPGSSEHPDIFAEAATWPDAIRSDPRFNDESGKGSAIPGLPDNGRHKNWHFVDINADGEVVDGLLDRQIEELSEVLRSEVDMSQISYALPWLLHLVADIHQPLHVGRHGDEGGNRVDVENPYNRRWLFSSLHTYWDDLPGPPWLRGKRLEQKKRELSERYRAPEQANVRRWRDESHRLLIHAYPDSEGNLPAFISEEFHRRASEIAGQRIIDAGYRLGRLLEEILNAGVSRETR
jgi:hypothetical protein